MALIDSITLLGIADRAAEQYNILQAAFASANVEGGGWYFDRSSATEDPQIEIPLDAQYHETDEDFDITLGIKNGTSMANIVLAMLNHFNQRNSSNQPLQVGGWDGYATVQDVRYSWWFNELFFAVKNQYLLANNVFSESDDVFGTVTMPTWAAHFVDGVNYGTGSDTNLAKGSYFAATQLKVVVGTPFGGSNLELKLSVKDINNLMTTINVTIPGGSAAGTEIPVGTPANRFLDVTSVASVGPNFGSVGDTVTINNLKERQIAL